jgi:hypothetical protein
MANYYHGALHPFAAFNGNIVGVLLDSCPAPFLTDITDELATAIRGTRISSTKMARLSPTTIATLF